MMIRHPGQESRVHEVVIIGAGPAGLTAASYLGRFLRPALLIDGGASRARWIPESHNIPGFPQGIVGRQLLATLRDQAIKYGTSIQAGDVRGIKSLGEHFELSLDDEQLSTRYVLLATGLEDRLPDLSGADEALLRSLLRVCPVCDGYESAGKQIAVIGDSERAEHEAQFLLTYSNLITVIDISRFPDASRCQRLQALGIEYLQASLSDLLIEENDLRLRQSDGKSRTFDCFYTALGCSPRNELAAALGTQFDQNNALIVDAHQQTSVDRLYAAGDIVRGLNQVVVAAAEAAIAATAIHNRLRSLT